MLGGGVIAGELWWPGQKLISIPQELPFPHGWTIDEEIIEPGLFGLAPIKPEGAKVVYDPGAGDERVEWSRVDDPEDYRVEPLDLTEENLESVLVGMQKALKNLRA